MEFLDEETRPRFVFQSGRRHPSPSQSSRSQLQYSSPLRNRTLFISLSLSSSLLFFAFCLLYLQSEPLKSLFFWFSLSLFLGPFAPSSVTAGDIRVGLGPTLPPPPSPELEISDEPNKKGNRRSKSRKVEELGTIPMVEVVKEERKNVGQGRKGDLAEMEEEEEEEEEREWSDLDLDLLRKQVIKHPVGKPGRWEAVAEAFKGRHGVDSVIKMAKSMGEKKMSDSDSFARFLKDRKPVDKRNEGANEGESSELRRENGEAKKEIAGLNWSSVDDLALLNALKAFPKDVSMRWEKISASVPGKSKAACIKRVAELKRDFRSSKA